MTTDYETHKGIAHTLLNVANELGGVTTIKHALAAAQVHATLALAAATAHGTGLDPFIEVKDQAGSVEQLPVADRTDCERCSTPLVCQRCSACLYHCYCGGES
jgi:hypothetical protein